MIFLQSRSKVEDPEQLKLKQKAKEMQRAEMEEARQREANETALMAIGPRKRMKLLNGMTSNSPFGGQFNSSTSGMGMSSLGFSSPNGKLPVRFDWIDWFSFFAKGLTNGLFF